MGKKIRHIVIVEYIDVFGDKHETEYCLPTKEKALKRIDYLKHIYKHDSFIANFNIYYMSR